MVDCCCVSNPPWFIAWASAHTDTLQVFVGASLSAVLTGWLLTDTYIRWMILLFGGGISYTYGSVVDCCCVSNPPWFIAWASAHTDSLQMLVYGLLFDCCFKGKLSFEYFLNFSKLTGHGRNPRGFLSWLLPEVEPPCRGGEALNEALYTNCLYFSRGLVIS